MTPPSPPHGTPPGPGPDDAGVPDGPAHDGPAHDGPAPEVPTGVPAPDVPGDDGPGGDPTVDLGPPQPQLASSSDGAAASAAPSDDAQDPARTGPIDVSDAEVDARFAELVALFDGDGTVPRPERPGPERPVPGRPGTGRAVPDRAVRARYAQVDPGRHRGAHDGDHLDVTDAGFPDDVDEREWAVDPGPVRLPRDPYLVVAWALLVAGLCTLGTVMLVWRTAPGWVPGAAVSAMAVGFVLLVARLPHERDDLDDDGAVV